MLEETYNTSPEGSEGSEVGPKKPGGQKQRRELSSGPSARSRLGTTRPQELASFLAREITPHSPNYCISRALSPWNTTCWGIRVYGEIPQ